MPAYVQGANQGLLLLIAANLLQLDGLVTHFGVGKSVVRV